MLQVDLLFSYGMSSGMALASGDRLVKEESPWVNKYFLLNVLWLALCFSPQMLYLLRRFPAWESMFVIQRYEDVPAWFISSMSIAMMVMGGLGFAITCGLLRRGKAGAAVAQVIWSIAAALFLSTFGWDGTGYRRLLYAGTGADWAKGVSYAAADFLSSPVFFDLLWLEALLIIPYGILVWIWIRGR